MNKKQNPKINIGHISGDVVISQNQKGGVTSHNSSTKEVNPKKRTFFNNKYVRIIGFTAAILGILAYFGFQPSKPNGYELQNLKNISLDSNITTVFETTQKKDTIFNKKVKMKNPENKKESDNPISIGDVSGDVVISQNQTGGITAHSVNINEIQSPEWSIGKSEKISDSEWRTILSAMGRGNMAYYNWNILLTLNTEVIRKEDVPDKVSVGPWMPLSVQGSNLSKNHFFIGFSEFKPGQYFSIYLYSKEPIKVLKIDVLGK